MILTNCAACAAPLAHNAPRCVRCHTRYLHLFGSASWEVETPIASLRPTLWFAPCHTRYCDATCQHDHWRRGHKQICKRIHRGGNAEQYYADKKYKEAVAEAVEACADDTKGQTCYICTQALHWKTKEGLVRGCACRGTAGFAHVSCLAEQAKILVAEAMDRNLDPKASNERWERWATCGLCKQDYHGVVACALGWSCWKTYVGRPEGDQDRIDAMTELGNGLSAADQNEDALSVGEAELSTLRRFGGSEYRMSVVQGNLACTYEVLGRLEEALSRRQDVYAATLKLTGEESRSTLLETNNYAGVLVKLNRFEEARTVLHKNIPVVRRVLGENDEETLKMRWNYAAALFLDDSSTLDDLREAVTTLEDAVRISRRVFGPANPIVGRIGAELRDARAALRVRESPLPSPWEVHRNDAGKPYYHNRETGESVWTLPDELLARETPPPGSG